MKLRKGFKFLSFGLVVVVISFFSLQHILPLANAETTDTETTIDTVPEPTALLQKEAIEHNPDGSEEITAEVEGDEDDPMISPQSVSTTKTLNLAVGKSWSKSFKMNTLTGSNHNAFNTKISNVTSGKYKVIITGSNGYKYESTERTTDTTFTTTNAKKDVTYTVTIINTSANNLKAKADITSYIK